MAFSEQLTGIQLGKQVIVTGTADWIMPCILSIHFPCIQYIF